MATTIPDGQGVAYIPDHTSDTIKQALTSSHQILLKLKVEKKMWTLPEWEQLLSTLDQVEEALHLMGA